MNPNDICEYKNGEKVRIEEVYTVYNSKGEHVKRMYDILFLGTLVKGYDVPEGWLK